VLLLLTIAAQPYLHPETARAAGFFQYKMLATPVGAPMSSYTETLNKLGADGWEVVTGGQVANDYVLVLKK
jgi:hypothetical protein